MTFGNAPGYPCARLWKTVRRHYLGTRPMPRAPAIPSLRPARCAS